MVYTGKILKNIIEKNHYIIQQIIKKFTGNYSEDIEQEVLIRTYKNLDKYKEQNKFTQWISTITANLCRDYLKSAYFKSSQHQTNEDETINNIKEKTTPEKTYLQKERQKIVLKAVDSLPSKLKKTLVLYEFENYSYEQISKKLNISIGTVKSRINSARKTLKEKLSFLLEE